MEPALGAILLSYGPTALPLSLPDPTGHLTAAGWGLTPLPVADCHPMPRVTGIEKVHNLDMAFLEVPQPSTVWPFIIPVTGEGGMGHPRRLSVWDVFTVTPLHTENILV